MNFKFDINESNVVGTAIAQLKPNTKKRSYLTNL